MRPLVAACVKVVSDESDAVSGRCGSSESGCTELNCPRNSRTRRSASMTSCGRIPT